ncbi:MAG TPA: methionine--tRNA ligase [Rikenellaceae bacterium]|nr:MAG: methionine--tRNA ligase [Bacteroidetes bacterium GWE2_40_15]HBZ25219.1 methionine--tRNA ligase [Rikenellaceae bacterium]
MNSNFKRHLITAALPYANGAVHIGHLAGVYIPADIYARYLRMRGEDVRFICGSDEHGVPITIKAKQNNCTPQEIVDKYHLIIKDSFERLGISFDIYSRTSSAIHHKTASEFFKKLYSEGKFIERESEQYYDEQANQFLADRYICGTCPKCMAEGAYGDQCEKCGSTLSPTELINPKSTLSGNVPIMKRTSHWYLPLDQYEPWLKEWILEGHKEWKVNVYGQCKSWLDGGLQPRAVSRDLDWGVPVPVDGAVGKVLYVWFDAPIGYISNTIELMPNDWERWWKSEDTKLVHFIGKDNIVFHCIVFPAMLKAYGDGYILPENVPANEFLNLEGNKISTSRNWAVWLHEYLDEFPGKEDVLRYVLCANAPETKDNDFTWKDFQTRNNSELVGIFGNFVNRAVVLTHKYFEGETPAALNCLAIDDEVLSQIPILKKSIEDNLENYKFREALREAMNLARLGNKYLTDTEPWKVVKTDPERVATILNISLQICANLAIAFEPILPHTTKKLRYILNMKTSRWEEFGNISILHPGHKLNEATLLFEKIEDGEIEFQIAKLQATKSSNEATAVIDQKSPLMPLKPECTYEQFSGMDIRTATVLEAERVPKTDKLLKLTIDTGLDIRTIVSGIAEYYSVEEMVGKQICILANLAPRKIKGIESKGMILMAKEENGKMKIVSPEQRLENGSAIS